MLQQTRLKKVKPAKNKIKLEFNKTMYGVGGGEKLGIFLSRHRSAWKRRESYVNQGVAKNDVNRNFVFVKVSHS